MNDFENRLDDYIQEFDLENQLYKKGSEFKKRGWLEKDEFLMICLWKSRRPKNLYLKNTPQEIRKATRLAFSEKDEKTKIEFLTKLSGVSIPTASAILSVTDPQKYPIIDIRCVKSLRDLGYIKWERITVNNWIDYLNIIRQIGKEHNKNARDIEKGLFAFNRITLDKTYKNLYKKPTLSKI